MSGQAELLTELQLLLMEQRDAVRENVSVDEIQDCAERQKRIEALLLQLNNDGLPESSPKRRDSERIRAGALPVAHHIIIG